MKRFICRRPITAWHAVFCLLLAASAPARAAIPPAESLLPSDTLFVVTIPNFATLKTRAGLSPQWRLWNDPAMKPFRENVETRLKKQFVGPLGRDLGVNLADFADLPQGQLTFAATGDSGNGAGRQSPGLLLLLDAGHNAGLLETNLEALKRKWLGSGKSLRTERIRGVAFSVVTLSSNDIPPSLAPFFPHGVPVQELGRPPERPKACELVVGQYRSLLIAGNSVAAVAPVVAHLTGSAMPALRDDASFATDKLLEFRNAPLYYGWFNARALFRILKGLPSATPNPEAPTVFPRTQWGEILDAVGLSGVRSISLAFRQNADGAENDLYIAAPQTSRAGIFRIFATERKNAAPPPFVPADAAKFWRWRVDGRQSWRSLQQVLDGVSPAAAAAIKAAIALANARAQLTEPAFDLREYLFDNLGDDFLGYQEKPAAGAPPGTAPRSLFLFSAQNSANAIAAVQTLVSLASHSEESPPAPDDFEGHGIYSIPLGGGAAGGNFLYCAAGGGYVALTADRTMLEQYLRGAAHPADSLAATRALLQAAQRVGGARHGFFAYENERDTMRSTFETLKRSGAAMRTSPPGFHSRFAALSQWADFSLLPDYDAVAKYFYFVVYAGDSTAEGLSFKTFAPDPPALRLN